MRGDETQSALAKEGPRHAAPRKSLLNRIQGPAGKAMALAAMPTAVLVGMGLTPRLALADDKDIPFAPGPCVTRSDEPTPEASETPKPEESTKPTATATPTDTPSATATPSATVTPSGAPAPTATQTGQTAAPQTQEHATTAPAPAATPTATPSPTQSKNPLDPLGLGDALKDLFDGPDGTPTATPTTAAPTTPAPQQTEAPADKAPATDTPAPTATASSKPKPAEDPDADRTRKAIEKAAAEAGATVEELPESAKGLDAKPDADIPDGAKPRFPCPVPDPEALAAAELEPGIPLLPDEPWRLDSTRLELIGLKYHGIVEVKTAGGKVKKALKFTASNVKIRDLHQTTVHSEGLSGHVRSARGEDSTITDGTVTMYTESLKGNLFGLIPVTFTPETPPPLDVPWAVFTKVTVIQAGQFGGTLRIPGLHNTIEPS
ncbi:hypothetical protein GCM10010275_01120 [Streptomyces litmocidini]|uniref:hypothetical protein n=1 Tax=Streptomyces litmocidini TaxID=67318 RepID=UPI00167C936B|nr:hypothetical protein [Streptomyces litmocidini]GGU70942.1 hypothetical protein GCM10010275_01120 [Streptomyces litmocidini]